MTSAKFLLVLVLAVVAVTDAQNAFKSPQAQSSIMVSCKFVVLACLLLGVVAAQSRGNNNEKTGTCPASLAPRAVEGQSNNNRQGNCPNDCNRDSDCRGDKKCCSTSCGGRTCTDPAPAAKPGQCDANLVQGVCRRECERDADCRRDQKCCRTTCSGTTDKPGHCTPGLSQFNCAAECQRDQDCRGDFKCCVTTCGGRMCSSPQTLTTTTQRPGGCPRPAEHPGEYVCRSNCSNDRDCNRNKKCCSNRCGAKVCT
ncbi:hypothetical protein B566_EDAN009941 [Ephemera danica]|nr:hypothetical protein B566_EDAN009941 [Ephemera danica]